MYRSLIALTTIVLISGAAHAEPDENDNSRREHRGPPAEALEACANAVQGDPCSFEGQRGESLDGNCEAPNDKPLACRPEGPPPGNQLERK